MLRPGDINPKRDTPALHRLFRKQAQRRREEWARGKRRSPVVASPRPSMDVQSLLFGRDTWTTAKARAWAKSHGYKYGKVDVTDQYIRIRQFDPKGFKVKRTIPFGRGIRAVVAREERSMRTTTTKEATRRRRRSAKKATARKTPKRRPRRRARKVTAVAAPRRRPRRKVRVAARRSRRRSRRARAPSMVMETKRRRRKSRRRVTRATESWRGDSAGHRKAARKGHRRRKAASHPKRRRRAREAVVAETPKRRRRSKSRRRTRETTMEAHRSRRRYHREAKRGGGMGPAELAMAVVSAGFGFVIADGLDRLLATYDPSGKPEDKPKDKFTSDGAGTLANTLNVAAMPNWQRLVAGVGVVAAPTIGAMYVQNPMVKSSLEGAAIGAGVSLFRTLWNNVLMPLLIGKDTTVPVLQKSYIARLYPAEVAAHINQRKTDDKGAAITPQMAVSSTGSGALSDPPPTAGVGAPADVGPFALAAESPYPDAGQALRREAGVHDQFPTVQNTWGTGGPGSDHPTAAQAMGTGAPGWQPGPPPGPGPGPQAEQPTDPACGCIGDDAKYSAFLGDAPEETSLFSMSGPA